MNSEYKLLDCGEGRRLESFGGVVCDRSAPMAMWKKSLPTTKWEQAELYFNENSKTWTGSAPDNWTVEFNGIVFKLETASNGQIGIFPEQRENWQWINNLISNSDRNIKVLNAFAHTGGSSIAALRAGGEVCHLDSAKSANNRARANAELSGCADAKVRWMTEDAIKFMAREVKRGSTYDAIILDPPAFGRMGKKIWKFEKNMPELLELTVELLSDNPLFLLLTSHNTGWDESDQKKFVATYAGSLLNTKVTAGGMKLEGEGNALPLGVYLRVEY